MTSSYLLPFFLVAGFIVLLNILFCCYLTRLRRSGRGASEGYKKIRYKKSRRLNETCAICLEDFQSREQIGQCPCKHAFHILCISKWFESRNTCPVCKASPRPERPTENSYLVSI